MIRSLQDVASDLGLAADDLDPWGPGAAKLRREVLWHDTPSRGRLCLVSALTPTPAGEGKTTTAIGLADGLRAIGHTAVVALREPSIAPVLGR